MIVKSEMVNYQHNVVIHRAAADDIKISIDTKYSNNPRSFLKEIWTDVYNMFLNGLTEEHISKLITVNVIGYRKSSKELDIRYNMALHEKCRSETILRNTYFYIDSSLQHKCFDVAIESCISDFNKLRSEFGSDFYSELNELIERI